MPTFTISIAVHNNLESATKPCLESLVRWCGRDLIEIIVTDNCSTDGTPEYLREMQAQGWPITVVTQERNEGFPAAHNRALTLARGAYFLVLNNDIVITGPGLIKQMYQGLHANNVALVGDDSAFSELDELGRGRTGPRTEYIEGSCMMGQTAFLDEVGLFDPAFEFAYCEDADLSLRLRNSGYELLRLHLPILHHVGTTVRTAEPHLAARLQEAYTRNHKLFRQRWAFYLEYRRFA